MFQVENKTSTRVYMLHLLSWKTVKSFSYIRLSIPWSVSKIEISLTHAATVSKKEDKSSHTAMLTNTPGA